MTMLFGLPQHPDLEAVPLCVVGAPSLDVTIGVLRGPLHALIVSSVIAFCEISYCAALKAFRIISEDHMTPAYLEGTGGFLQTTVECRTGALRSAL